MFGTLQQLHEVEWGEPLHCLALCADLHPLEREVGGLGPTNICIAIYIYVCMYSLHSCR